ncbi:BRO family protein [Desulfosporosinus sp. SB140]|uniref:BRO family protein n=1 Tax=Desulfosporosinus paludis TaxID=3115649 RepID=UPI00388F0A07
MPWFVSKDVCDALGIGHTRNAVKRLNDNERNTVYSIHFNRKRGNQECPWLLRPGYIY